MNSALFKSIYFGTGDFAKNIYQLNRISDISENISTEEKTKFNNRINDLIIKINETNPDFFNKFKSNISSGDHYLIKEEIQKGAYIMQENLEVIFPELKKIIQKVKSDVNSGKLEIDKNASIQDYENQLTEVFNENPEYKELLNNNMISGDEAIVPCSWAVVCVVYFAIAAHNTIAVTALIYFKVAFWGPSIDKKNSVNGSLNDDSDVLNTEILINEIAEYFGNENEK